VHINTELRLAWRKGLEQGLHQREQEIVPYKILPGALKEIQKVASSRLGLITNPLATQGAGRF